MHVPPQYVPADHVPALETIRGNPLSLLATEGGGTPFATHILAIPDPEEAGRDPRSLIGSTLLGHMDRTNPHWDALRDGDRALLVFTGADAYVSPTVYETVPAAPTWDFVAVHVRGTVRKLTALEDTLRVVRRTVEFCEEHFGTGWDLVPSLDYFRRIVPGVGAFELTVESVDSMFKLSQEQAPALQERVVRSFEDSVSTVHRALAETMRGSGVGTAGVGSDGRG
jgi:transcriptional regulator